LGTFLGAVKEFAMLRGAAAAGCRLQCHRAVRGGTRPLATANQIDANAFQNDSEVTYSKASRYNCEVTSLGAWTPPIHHAHVQTSNIVTSQVFRFVQAIILVSVMVVHSCWLTYRTTP
jgi:hypothetical protein